MIDSDRLRRALTAVEAGVGHRAAGRYDEAVSALSVALDEASVAHIGDDLIGRISNELGIACKYAGWYVEGRRHLRRAHEILTARYGESSREVASACHNIGGILHSAGELEEAETWSRRAVRTRAAAGAPNRELVADEVALAAVLCDLGQLDEAEQLLAAALDWYEQVLGPDHLEVAVTLANLAAVVASRRDLDTASGYLRRAVAIKERALGADHPSTAQTRRSLENCLVPSARHHAEIPYCATPDVVVPHRGRRPPIPGGSPMPSMTSTGIAYDDSGSGDVTLLFLPGWCGPRTLFQPLTDRLAGRCRTLAVDWRGHGESAAASGDFGIAELVDDALTVVEESGATTIVPVTVAHAGWVGIEVRRRLGADRVPKLAFLDWMVLGAPGPFLDALAAMSDPSTTRQTVEHVSQMWPAGLDTPALLAYVESMTAFPDEMWARAAREITDAFAVHTSPLAAVAALDDPPPTLHLYAQPADPAFHAAQQAFAADHPWFHVERLDAASHFPMFEIPDVMSEHLDDFVNKPAA